MKKTYPYLIIVTVLVLATACTSTKSWQSNPYSLYSKQNYLCAVGYGETEETAQVNAKIELAFLFGLSVEASQKLVVMEETSSINGYSKDSYSNSFSKESKTSTNIDNLFGIEIVKLAKTDSGFVALAVMKKDTSILYYQAQLPILKEKIENLNGSITKLDSFASLKEVANLISLVKEYNKDVTILNFLASSNEEYLLESEFISKFNTNIDNIALQVRINGEDNGLIKSTVSKLFTNLGFKIANDTNKATALAEVTITWQDTKGNGNSFVFAQYFADISIKDIANNETVFVYSTSDKEGHQNIESARTRAINRLIQSLETELTNNFISNFSY